MVMMRWNLLGSGILVYRRPRMRPKPPSRVLRSTPNIITESKTHTRPLRGFHEARKAQKNVPVLTQQQQGLHRRKSVSGTARVVRVFTTLTLYAGDEEPLEKRTHRNRWSRHYVPVRKYDARVVAVCAILSRSSNTRYPSPALAGLPR